MSVTPQDTLTVNATLHEDDIDTERRLKRLQREFNPKLRLNIKRTRSHRSNLPTVEYIVDGQRVFYHKGPLAYASYFWKAGRFTGAVAYPRATTRRKRRDWERGFI